MEQVPPETLDVLQLSPAERADRGLDETDVSEALHELLAHGTEAEKELTECTFPAVSLANHTVEPDETHPAIFRNCTFEGTLDLTGAHFKLPLVFENCTFDEIQAEGAWFEDDLVIQSSQVRGAVDTFEARFVRDADFTETTFEAPVKFDETSFEDDTRFDGVQFANVARFRAAEFEGKSNELDDNATFVGTHFAADAEFTQATFEHVVFRETTVDGDAKFREAGFDGDADCRNISFGGSAVFEETVVDGDIDFEGAVFTGPANFDGCELRGGARSLHDDARFVGVTFEDTVSFEEARVRGFNAAETTFEVESTFDEFHATEVVTFERAAFHGPSSFRESLFTEDAEFTDARFRDTVTFRGAGFEGATADVGANAHFDGVRFEAAADFSSARFTAATFEDTAFAGTLDFSETVFDDDSQFRFTPTTNETYVDFTGAIIKEGTITQPESAWVSYDFTNASLGSVSLRAASEADRKQLLDYFRFCNTEFNEFDSYEFDFAAHTGYLDRNGWVLHHFEDSRDEPDYAVAMTPETIESTYLRAKTAASTAGQMKPAGEFRVKRQQYARRKYVDIARDATTDLSTRLLNAGRAAENAFLGVTCGHGMRLVRIISVFLLFPILPALLYTFGGPTFATTADGSQLASLGALATAEGQTILYNNISFSYITFLTIGYGNVGPSGALARVLAAAEVYVNVILSGLVLYGLIKRSEI